MDTFELLPSLAQGELAETSAPELVAAVFRSRASGTLWVDTGDSEVRCFFRAGDMCGSGAFKNFQTLAHVLLANDWVEALDIESSRDDAAARGKRHGEVLVEKGLLTHDQLRTALGAQHTANLTTLLSLTTGRYDWRGWEPPPPWAREVAVDPVSCLIDALELEQHAPRRQKVLDWLGRHAARLSHDWPELQDRVTLTDGDRRAAALLAVPRRLSEFVPASRLPQTRAEALLVALLLAGGVEPQAGASGRAPAAEEEGPLDPELKPLDPELNPLEEAPALELSVARQAEELIAAADQPLELDLDRGRGAGADEERSRELRKKMLARGIRNLGAAPQQQPKDGGMVVELPQEAPADDGQLSPEDQRFVDEVRSRSRLAQRQNAYARLGVSPGAPLEHMKTAYISLAKRFHPDRSVGPGLSSIQPELQTLFALLKEAWDSVGTPDARARYDEQLRNGGRSSSRKEEAALSLKMGEVLFKKRDFEAAINKIRRAVDLDATGDALAALAWALVGDPRCSAGARDEAATLINRALRAPGVTARTYYVAGVLWRTKDPDSAADAFRKALELEPQHSDAALELRLLEQRRGKATKNSGGVLSGLLFGKRKS